MELLTTFEGRIGRKGFWMGVLILIGIAIVVSFLLVPIFSRLGFIGSIIQLAIQLVMLYFYAAIATKRLHDHNKPQMPMLAIFIGPSLVLSLMQTFGIGFTEQAVGNVVVQAPGLLGYIVLLVSFAVAIWALVLLGIMKGTDGPNDFGPDPVG